MKKILLVCLLLFICSCELIKEDIEVGSLLKCDPETQWRKTTITENGKSECIFCNEQGEWEQCEMASVTILLF